MQRPSDGNFSSRHKEFHIHSYPGFNEFLSSNGQEAGPTRKRPLIAIALGLRERRDLAAWKDRRRGEGDCYRVFHRLETNLSNSDRRPGTTFFVVGPSMTCL